MLSACLREEIDPTVPIVVQNGVVQNGSVRLKGLKHRSDAPLPAIRDIFVRDMGMIAFTPAPGGKVPGFPCDADRIQNAKFTK